MRILLALGICILLLGGTYLYTRISAAAISDFKQSSQVPVDQNYSVELTRTFTAVPRSDESESSDHEASKDRVPTQKEAIRVLFKGQAVLSRKDRTAPADICVIDRLEGVESGRNEVFVCARVEPPKPGELAALNVRVRSGGRIVAEGIFASQQDSPLIYGTVVFDAGKSGRKQP